MSEPTTDDDQRIVQEMIGRFDSPFFIRRAKLVETTWEQVLASAAAQRLKWLTMVRLRLGQLHALAGSWDVLAIHMPDPDEQAEVRRLFEALQPRLRLPLEATASVRVLRSAARDLVEAMEMFNSRWIRWLAKVDLRAVNQARVDYNRYYLFEKECAFGSALAARLDYREYDPVRSADLEAQFPLLRVPHFVFD